MIRNFADFCKELSECGFSMGGGNAKGIYAVVSYDWKEQEFSDSPVKWHTGDPETDPWEWRMRVLEERNDIAYAKVFFKTSGFITKEWYPYFYAVRRNGDTFEEAYGWSSTVFTTVEDFWEKRGISLPDLDSAESYEKIRTQILRLNPDAEQKKIAKFIKG